jgi:hypothetical protein
MFFLKNVNQDVNFQFNNGENILTLQNKKLNINTLKSIFSKICLTACFQIWEPLVLDITIEINEILKLLNLHS